MAAAKMGQAGRLRYAGEARSEKAAAKMGQAGRLRYVGEARNEKAAAGAAALSAFAQWAPA